MKIEQTIDRMIAQLKTMPEIIILISECVYLDHPIILDIRWGFHLSLSKIEGFEPWESRGKWEECIRGYKYTLFSLCKSLIIHKNFRENTIAILRFEIEELKEATKLREMCKDD